MHEEPVALRLRQRVDALGLERVLRGEDEERPREGARLAGDRHVPFAHRLEQRRLDLRGRAVDLVREHDVREQRAPLDREVLARRPPGAGPDEVGGHQVRRELQPGEVAAHGLRHRRHGQRLGQAGKALDQAVAVGEQADHDPLDEEVLTHDDLLDLEQGIGEQRRVIGARDGHRWGSGPGTGHWWSLRCPLGWEGGESADRAGAQVQGGAVLRAGRVRPATFTVSPGSCADTAACRASAEATACPSTAVSTSSCSMPARSAGDPGTTPATCAPAGALRAARDELDPQERGATDVDRARGAPVDDLPRDRPRLVDRDGEALGGRARVAGCRAGGRRRHDADDLSVGVHHGATGVTGHDGGIELDQPGQSLRRAVALVLHRDLLVEGAHRPGDGAGGPAARRRRCRRRPPRRPPSPSTTSRAARPSRPDAPFSRRTATSWVLS